MAYMQTYSVTRAEEVGHTVKITNGHHISCWVATKGWYTRIGKTRRQARAFARAACRNGEE